MFRRLTFSLARIDLKNLRKAFTGPQRLRLLVKEFVVLVESDAGFADKLLLAMIENADAVT